uniref:Phosphatase regulatory subunit family protein, variant n=1 Tax=Loa loa TaxID=7209 RepID=A0A1I7VYX6_LOALO
MNNDKIVDIQDGDLRSVGSDPSSSTLCPTICHRAASFPIVSRHHPTSSLLKVRSQSESDALNRLGLINSRTTLIEQLKKRQLAPITFEKSLDNAGESDANLGDNDCVDGNVGDFDQLSLIVENVVVKTTKAAVRSYKSVHFADDCGKDLTTVRVMTEPSDYPPAISASVIRRLLGETDEEEKFRQTSASWVISFKQPASEYVKFRETLERGFVALENVVLKNEICRMVGTIKVKNITFEKKVFVRFTSDGWKSFLDRMATYQPSSSKFYDTFSFDVELPTNGSDPDARIEFCICFETGSSQDDTKQQQYWDSNNGRNYVLTSQETLAPMSPLPISLSFGKHDPNDAYTCEFDDWTKFAAWRNLPTEGPYW